MLKPVRHGCNARLFDCEYEVQVLHGPRPDILVKCPRCSRSEKRVVLIGYRVRLPHYVAPIPPEPILCSNLNCLARLCDLALPYTLVETDGDFVIACQKCGEITPIILGGVAAVI